MKFEHEVLLEFGFDEKMFQVRVTNPESGQEELREAELNRIERDWFARRVNDWRRLLSDPMAGAIAREALMNELYLKRLQQSMSRLEIGSARWRSLYESKRQLETEFRKSCEGLQEMFPEVETSGRESFRMVVSALNEGLREYLREREKPIDRPGAHGDGDRSALAPERAAEGAAIPDGVDAVHHRSDARAV
jgi:hypothetical protein